MILYNFRNRGSFEYEKFALNALQLNNRVNYLLKEKTTNSLTEYDKNVDMKLKAIQNKSNQVYLELLEYWRC